MKVNNSCVDQLITVKTYKDIFEDKNTQGLAFTIT